MLNLAGQLTWLSVDSALLVGNPLGDPVRRQQAVYLPPGYDADRSQPYPVLYYLPGYGNDVVSTVAARPWERNLIQRADQLIVAGEMPAALIVVVDGWTSLGGSQYIDSLHNGPYARYITEEVVTTVDRDFHTNPQARGLFGHSSGGFGALHLAMQHPGVFGAIAAHSADSYFRYSAMPAFETTRRALTRFPSFSAFADDFVAREKRSGDLFEAMMTLAYAAAYSPRAAQAYAIDLPFCLATGELDEAVFARWLAFDPVEAMLNPAAGAALARLKLCFIDCGRQDEWKLDVGARIFAQRAKAQGVRVIHEEFEGKHSGVRHRLERSMPLLLEALK